MVHPIFWAASRTVSVFVISTSKILLVLWVGLVVQSNGMRNYRWNSVAADRVELGPIGTIPVLMACDRRKADGVVAHVSSVEEASQLGCVRVVDMDALELFASDGPAFQREYGRMPDHETLRLLGLLQLAEALKTRDNTDWEWARHRLASHPDPVFQNIKRSILGRQPGMELGRLLAEGLGKVQLVLWWKEEGRDLVILPGLRCPDVRSALYTLALVRIAGGKGLGACLNCGKPFVRQRGTRKTCSASCRYAMYERRSSEAGQAKEQQRRGKKSRRSRGRKSNTWRGR
ncbi:hypothetical protein LCGC14_3110080, partial [marine sediment metagenome]